MAARLKGRLKLLSPFVSEKLVRRLQNRFKNISQGQESLENALPGPGERQVCVNCNFKMSFKNNTTLSHQVD